MLWVGRFFGPRRMAGFIPIRARLPVWKQMLPDRPGLLWKTGPGDQPVPRAVSLRMMGIRDPFISPARGRIYGI